MIFPASCSTRAPVSSPGMVCTLVTVPALPALTALFRFGFDAAASVGLPLPFEEFGLAALGWLNTLLASARNWNFAFSQIAKFLKIDRLSYEKPGPCNVFLDVFPKA